MNNKSQTTLQKLLVFISAPFSVIYNFFRSSKTARVLLIIVIIKFSIFYGFFKSFLFPRYLKPKWESEEHRIEHVTKHIIQTEHQK